MKWKKLPHNTHFSFYIYIILFDDEFQECGMRQSWREKDVHIFHEPKNKQIKLSSCISRKWVREREILSKKSKECVEWKKWRSTWFLWSRIVYIYYIPNHHIQHNEQDAWRIIRQTISIKQTLKWINCSWTKVLKRMKIQRIKLLLWTTRRFISDN